MVRLVDGGRRAVQFTLCAAPDHRLDAPTMDSANGVLLLYDRQDAAGSLARLDHEWAENVQQRCECGLIELVGELFTFFLY